MRPLPWGGLAAIVAAVLTAGVTPALAADIPGNSRTKAVVTPGPARFEGVFEKEADSDWYRITLKAGRNYAFVVNSYCDARVRLRDAAGKVLRSSGLAWDEENDGFEFRSATTKTFFAEYVDVNPTACLEFGDGYPTGYAGHVAMEVRGDATTRATIAPGQTVDGYMNWVLDKDYFRVSLAAGRRYAMTVNGPMLTVVDPQGKVVAGDAVDPPRSPVEFTVPKSGTYYVVVAGDGYHYGSYTVGLSRP